MSTLYTFVPSVKGGTKASGSLGFDSSTLGNTDVSDDSSLLRLTLILKQVYTAAAWSVPQDKGSKDSPFAFSPYPIDFHKVSSALGNQV